MARGRKKKKEKPEHRLAVVEEVADNIYSVKFILQSLGYEVDSFSWADNYLERIAAYAPEVVLVDMMIPAKGGYSVLRGLKESPLKKIPTLAITADAMEGEDDDVAKAGADEILQKPYTVGDLQKKLKKYLKKKEEKGD